MKKIALLLITMIIASTSYSQNLLSLRGSTTVIFEENTDPFFGPGISFQRGITSNLAVGANIDYKFGSNSVSLLNIEPRVDFYLNEVFNGLHIGTNFAFDIQSVGDFTANVLNLGLNGGYTLSVLDKICVDVYLAPAYMMSLEEGGDSEIAINPGISVGFQF